MARQEAKPQGPREGGPAARGRRGRPRAHGLNRAAGRAARFPGVRGSRAASQDAPPLLLGLLLLAALPEHCLADPGKHLAAALRPRRFLEERDGPSRPVPDRVAVDGEIFAAPALGFSPPFAAATAGRTVRNLSPGKAGTVGRGSKKKCIRVFLLDKLRILPSGPIGTLHLGKRHAVFRTPEKACVLVGHISGWGRPL